MNWPLELRLNSIEHLLDSSLTFWSKLELVKNILLKLLEIAIFLSDFAIVDGALDIGTGLLAHVISKAHVVFVKVCYFIQTTLLLLLLLLRIFLGTRTVFNIVDHIISNDLIKNAIPLFTS